MTTVRLDRTHHPVTVLGYGVRAGVWVQGCGIGCHGCISQDTWSPAGGVAVPVSDVVAWVAGLPEPLDGVTVSGGEPFDQPEALAELLEGIRALGREHLDVLVYSGRPWSQLARRPAAAAALDQCDVVVAGPYVQRRNHGSSLRGSDNQRVVTLTALGRERYPEASAPTAPRMQVAVGDGSVLAVGIPRPGDMDHLVARLADFGVSVGETTWRP